MHTVIPLPRFVNSPGLTIHIFLTEVLEGEIGSSSPSISSLEASMGELGSEEGYFKPFSRARILLALA